jgi:hypothetical protein
MAMKTLLTALFVIAATLSGVASSAAECYLPWNARPDLRMMWLQADCRYWFPRRDGFAARPRNVVLRPGTVIDRFGQPGGQFLAPAGASYMGRAVPYDRLKMPYYRYVVLRPLRVKAGKAAPWFDQPGGGIQYKTDGKVQDLLARGYLKQVW